VKVTEEAIENAFVRAPFDGGRHQEARAEDGRDQVRPFGVAGQRRARRAIATIADLGELEVQTEVSETAFETRPAMPAEVKLQAYPDQAYKGRLRQIFPSSEYSAKAIRGSARHDSQRRRHVKPEMPPVSRSRNSA